MQVFLALSGHPKANVRQVILGRTTVIGRSRNCGLQIASASISRKHCELRISDDAVSVVDLGSSNGTFVGSERLPAGEEHPLPPGSLLNVGGVRFLVNYAPAAAQAATDVAPAAAPSAPAAVEPAAVEEEPILEDDVFVLDEPIATRPATAEPVTPAPAAAAEAAPVDQTAEAFTIDDEPDLAAMFADEPAPTRATTSEPEAELAADEPILASDEDDAFAFLTEDDPAPVESRREDSRLGA